MKVTVFNGSPRGKNSNSHRIIEPLLQGAKQAGAETEEVFLIEKNIQLCRGCFTCWGKTPGKCVIKDDMTGMLEKLLNSDYAGMASPVYNMYQTGLLKNFTDRFLPLATPHIRKNEDGTFYHEGRVQRFPKQFFIFNSGFPGEHNFDLLQAFVSIVKQGDAGSVVLEIYRNCGEVLGSVDGRGDDPIAQRINEFRDALQQAGREIVTDGRVRPETVAQLHREIVSDAEYMAVANRHWDEMIGK